MTHGSQAPGAQVKWLTGRVKLALLAWVVMVAFGAYLTESYLAASERNLVQRLGERMLATATAHEQAFRRTLDALDSIHRLMHMRHSLIRSGHGDATYWLSDELTALAKAERFGVLQMAEIDRDGMVTWSTVPDWKPVYLGDREHFKVHAQGRDSVFISKPLVGRVSNRWSLQITRPLFWNGAFDGVSVVSLDPFQVGRTIGQPYEQMDEAAEILNRDTHTIIATSANDPDQLGAVSTLYNPAIFASTAPRSGYQRWTDPASGDEMIFAYVALQGLPYMIVVRRAWAEAAQPLHTMAVWVRSSLLAGSLLALGAILLAAQVYHALRIKRLLAAAEAAQAITEATWMQLDQLMRTLPAAVFSGEIGGEPPALRMRYISANITELSGLTSEEMKDPATLERHLDAASQNHLRDLLAQLAAKEHASTELRLRRPDDGWVWFHLEVRVNQRRGVQMEVSGYMADITEQRTLRAQAIAAGKLSTLGEMAAGMAHELNQPLSVIAMATGNLMLDFSGEPPPSRAEITDNLVLISGQAIRCREIIRHLRQFSAPNMACDLRPVSLRTVIDGALLLTRSALKAEEITVSIEIAPDTPDVLADEVPVEQVLVNLLLNARDAIHKQPPSAPRRIAVWVRPCAAGVILTFADTGGGIAPDKIDRIFDPFFTTKPPDKGTGLGLSICHGIMATFGGSIAVENGPEGAIFTLRFRSAPVTGQAPGSERRRQIGEVGAA